MRTLPPLEETLRGSLLVGETSSGVVTPDQLDRVRQWIDNHQQVKDSLDRISAINRELLRREHIREKGKKKTA